MKDGIKVSDELITLFLPTLEFFLTHEGRFFAVRRFLMRIDNDSQIMDQRRNQIFSCEVESLFFICLMEILWLIGSRPIQLKEG
jgi:hypothetical protein